MKKRLLFCCAMAACFAAGAQAVGAWSNTGPVPFPVNESGQVHGIGRVSQLKFHATDPQTIYAASASGGLFITHDNGQNWAPTPGTETLPQTSCSAVCVDYTNDQTIYLSLGDANYYSDEYGIYKSTDGGLSWNASNSGIGNAMAVEILMSATSNTTLVAATSQGIYKTTNGGASWSLKQSGAFTDMKAKPGSTTTLYAAKGTAFYRSTDFGATWTQTVAASALPGNNGGIRIGVSAADPTRVYLVTTDDNGRIYSSSNSGASFTNVYTSATDCIVCYDADPASGSQGDYNLDLNVNPANASELLVAAHCVWRSTDGGLTWDKRTDWYDQVHTDMHHIEWNPYNNAQIFEANDGGVWMSADPTAQDWSPRADGLAATEIYHAAQSPTVRELASIGTQDNGELYYYNGIWRCNRGGDWGARNYFDYNNNGTVYYMENGNRRDLVPLGGDQTYNNPYNADNASRMEFVPSMTNVAFTGMDAIYRSTDINTASPSWTAINTANTEDVLGIASSHANPNVLYVVTSGSHVLRTTNALAATPTWTTLSTPTSTTNGGSLYAPKYNASIVFLTCGANVYRSANQGASWTNITGSGLATGVNIRRIIADDFSATERLFVNEGSYTHYKDNSTTAWTAINGLPTVCNATDFLIYNDSTAASILRVSTYGRGMWQTDINANLPPSVDFTADKQNICPGDTVHFTKMIYGSATSFSWSFAGGNPASSAAAAPAVVYSTPGVYNVTLSATSAGGTTTTTKTGYITVSYGQGTSVQEGFEGAVFPPQDWTLQSNSGANWQQSAAAGGYGLSTHSALFDNFNHDAGGAHNNLILPRVNTAGLSAARLTFDVAYAPYSTAYPDSLMIRISTDCGHTWTPVYVKSGTTLATAPAYTTDAFVPTATQWRTDTVQLTPYVGGSIQVSFENVGHYGQTLYIDNVNLLLSPLADFSAADTSVCAGTTVQFTSSATNALTYQWSFPGGTPASSPQQNPSVTYAAAGSYSVTLTATNALGSNSKTKTSYIAVLPAPSAAITASGSVLSANAGGAVSYQWYLGGSAINGATNATYTATQSGSYTVTVTGSNACAATSAAFSFTLGIAGLGGQQSLWVYPNPSQGMLTLEGSRVPAKRISIQCYSAAGALVSEETIGISNGLLHRTLDWTALPKGVYELRVNSGDATLLRTQVALR